ncbi:MAG: tetratricopeptide repeat protein [Bacillaceae bacterium]|nr:tetratricopeptide repeat protein [Bacillaceae bacterium]
MSKFFLFALLWWIIGNPIIAILVLLIILYFVDRRYVGLFPNLAKPVKRNRRIARLKQELSLNPHDTSNKLELARLYIEKNHYKQALPYLQDARKKMPDSDEVLYELGLCYLKLGDIEKGEQMIREALEDNERLKYGEPYLKLGEAFLHTDNEKALHYLETFKQIHASSSQAYYLLGQLYARMGKEAEAKKAFAEAVEIYKGLPKYKKRTERRWALLARLKGGA